MNCRFDELPPYHLTNLTIGQAWTKLPFFSVVLTKKELDEIEVCNQLIMDWASRRRLAKLAELAAAESATYEKKKVSKSDSNESKKPIERNIPIRLTFDYKGKLTQL
jgi:hypothetical protein